jgi:hypothetical protein
MNNDEFRDWWSDFTANFPDVGIWVANLPNGRDVLTKWRDMLGAVEAADAAAVTQAIATGRLDPIGTTDHERGGTGRRIAREAKRFAIERVQRERIASTAGCKDNERRYRCHVCRDTGLVTIVNRKAYETHGIVVANVNVRCNCDMGETWAHERSGTGTKYPPLKLYNEHAHFRAMDGVTNGTEVVVDGKTYTTPDTAAAYREWRSDPERSDAAHETKLAAAEWHF